MKINIVECIDAECDDDYASIKERLLPKTNIDYEELVAEGKFSWETKHCNLLITYSINNAIEIKVTDGNENHGYCATLDLDCSGLVYCTMSALRDYIKDIN